MSIYTLIDGTSSGDSQVASQTSRNYSQVWGECRFSAEVQG